MSETTTRRSLAGAFAPPPAARSARLMEALPPRSQIDQLADAAEPPAPPLTPPRSPSPPPPTYPDHNPSTADDVVRSVAVYLPPPLQARLRHVARTEELTYADVLVRAAANHIDTIATRFSPPPAPANPGMPARNRPCRPTPGIQTQLRLDGHQIAWLDEAAQRVRAPSRTALVVALLDAELPSCPPGSATR